MRCRGGADPAIQPPEGSSTVDHPFGTCILLGSFFSLEPVNAPPVAQRELLVAARRRATFAMRLWAGLIATGVVAFALLTEWANGGATVGGWIFQFLVGLTAVVTSCAGLFLTADAISSERREGTLGFLFLTDLTGFDVLLGKLLAAGLNAAGALLTILPVMAVTLLLGGVTAGDYWRSALALVNLLWVALAIGLAMSARTPESSRALVAALVWAVLLFLALPAGAMTWARWSNLPGQAELFGLSPVWTLFCARDVPFTLSPGDYWKSLAISHGLGWLFLWTAARRLPHLWRTDLAVSGVSATRGPIRSRRPASIENPVAALTAPRWRERGLVWLTVVVALVLLGVMWKMDWLNPAWSIWAAGPLAGGFFVLKCLFAWKCCAFFYTLRVGGGELLLTAPLNELQVLGGAWTGARRLVQTPLLLLTLVNFSLPFWGRSEAASGTTVIHFDAVGQTLFAIYQLLCVVADIVTLGWLSARFGLRSRGPIQALALCLALLFLPRLVLFCIPNLLLSILTMAWARAGIANSVRGWLTGDRLPPVHSRLEAARQGRIAPETV